MFANRTKEHLNFEFMQAYSMCLGTLSTSFGNVGEPHKVKIKTIRNHRRKTRMKSKKRRKKQFGSHSIERQMTRQQSFVGAKQSDVRRTITKQNKLLFDITIKKMIKYQFCRRLIRRREPAMATKPELLVLIKRNHSTKNSINHK